MKQIRLTAKAQRKQFDGMQKELHGINSADAEVDTMGESPMDNRSSMSVKGFCGLNWITSLHSDTSGTGLN